MAAPLKGLVLAAGLGTRLRPLTERWPKPLMPFAGTTPLMLALWRLEQVGCRENAVNSHHLAPEIAKALAENPFGHTLHHAFEPEILGTGGVYNPLRAWQGDATLVVLNGDVVSSVDLARLLARHRESGAVATMALLPEVIPGESGVWHEGGFVRGIGRTPVAGCTAGNFACVQVLSRQLVDLLPKTGAFDVISQGYQVALTRGLPVAAFVHDGFWHDLRTPRFYWEAVKDAARLLAAPAREAVGLRACRALRGLSSVVEAGGVLVDRTHAGVDPTARLGPWVVVEPGAVVGAGAVVEESLLLPGARVGAGATLRGVVLGATLSVDVGA